jgi:hypothetical protein
LLKKLYLGYTFPMKTAISVSDDIFELSERLAKRLKVSRSKIFAMGVEKLGDEFEKDEITRKLNDFYSENKAEIDPVVSKISALSLPIEEW